MNDEAQRIEQTAALLERAAREAQLPMTGDRRVSEQHAAQLLLISAGHLKLLRQEGAGPLFHRIPVNGCRISYRIDQLAEWIESRAQNQRHTTA